MISNNSISGVNKFKVSRGNGQNNSIKPIQKDPAME